MKTLLHFLLVYDLNRRELVEQETYDDTDEAAAAYADTEAKYRGRDDLEVVLVGIEVIRRGVEAINKQDEERVRRDYERGRRMGGPPLLVGPCPYL